MSPFDLIFFGVCTLLVLLGGVGTVAAKNPIRGAMGLLSAIVGIAGMYLQLQAEFLAAIQILVYAGAIVVLFLFVIMLLGPQATTSAGAAGTKVSRYFGAIVFGLLAAGGLWVAWRTHGVIAGPPKASPQLGTIEGIGKELFTTHLVPFELSGALLLVAVVGAIAVARGKQVDPTRDAQGPEAKPLLTHDGAASGPKPRAPAEPIGDAGAKEA